MRVLRVTIAGAVFLLASSGVVAVGQMMQQQPVQSIPTNPSRFPINDGHPPGDSDALPPAVLARQAKMRNDARQQQMVNDTNKLVQLATELKQEMGKPGKDVAPDDLTKKAEEIEKLAKSVKDRMKG